MRTTVPIVVCISGLVAFWSLGAETPPSKQTREPKTSEQESSKPAEPDGLEGLPEGLSPEARRQLIELLKKRSRESAHVSVLLQVTHYDLSAGGKSVRDVKLDAVKQSRTTGSVTTGRSRRGSTSGLKGIVTREVPNARTTTSSGRSTEQENASSTTQTSIMTTVGQPTHIAVLKRTTEVWHPLVIVPAHKARNQDGAPPKAGAGGEATSRIIENVVGTGMRVIVKAATPDAILMELCPYYRVLAEGSRRRSKRVYLEDLRDTVVAIPGLPVTLNGLNTRKSDRFDSIFSNVKEGGARAYKTVMRAQILIQRPGVHTESVRTQ